MYHFPTKLVMKVHTKVLKNYWSLTFSEML